MSFLILSSSSWFRRLSAASASSFSFSLAISSSSIACLALRSSFKSCFDLINSSIASCRQFCSCRKRSFSFSFSSSKRSASSFLRRSNSASFSSLAFRSSSSWARSFASSLSASFVWASFVLASCSKTRLSFSSRRSLSRARRLIISRSSSRLFLFFLSFSSCACICRCSSARRAFSRCCWLFSIFHLIASSRRSSSIFLSFSFVVPSSFVVLSRISRSCSRRFCISVISSLASIDRWFAFCSS
mmetsp:Transcript_5214/g.9170  ORF Transcript_5214/g.9170 Transcript_5214/m.9170 type:complete len:244 (-) Transcript_5214:3336-4067(-)